MSVGKLISRVGNRIFRIVTFLYNDNKSSSCFSGPVDIAVPPLEVEFMHHELAHELGELCKINQTARHVSKSSPLLEGSKANG